MLIRVFHGEIRIHYLSQSWITQIAIQPHLAAEVSAIRIPQFFLRSVPDLFGDEFELLEPENLSEGFSLAGQDAQVRFELATGEIYRVDIEETGEAVPKYKRADSELSAYIRSRLAQSLDFPIFRK